MDPHIICLCDASYTKLCMNRYEIPGERGCRRRFIHNVESATLHALILAVDDITLEGHHQRVYPTGTIVIRCLEDKIKVQGNVTYHMYYILCRVLVG